MTEKEKPPIDSLYPTKGDVLHSSVKASLSSVPIAGGILSEIFSFGIESPLEKRKRNFIITLDSRLTEIEKKGLLSVNDLKDNDEFIDIVTQSLEIALKNSQEEKIKWLQNAVLNTALKIDINRDVKIMFLNLLNSVTVTHFRVLNLWQNPEVALQKLVLDGLKKNKEIKTGHEVGIPEDLGGYLSIEDSIYKAVLKDLDNWNLLQNTSGSHKTGLPDGEEKRLISGLVTETKKRTTDFGRRFVQFIKEPQID